VRAGQRAQEIAEDTNLRKIVPTDFFTVAGEQIERIQAPICHLNCRGRAIK